MFHNNYVICEIAASLKLEDEPPSTEHEAVIIHHMIVMM